ncbi:hypothetical protein ABE356_000198 [Escherichia coli]|nr:hypothetical protein [Escherichia coli]
MKLRDDLGRLCRLYSNLVGIAEERNGKPPYYSTNATTRPGFAQHHITPVSMGGSDQGWNLVYFTHREHFLAHQILAYIYGGKLAEAWDCMCHMNRCRVTSRQFATASEMNRKARSERMKGTRHEWLYTDEAREKIKAALTGRKRDPAVTAKANATKLARGLIMTDQEREQANERKRERARERAAEKRRERGALSRSESQAEIMKRPEHLENIRQKLKAITLTCPHCGKTGGAGMYSKHFDYCLQNPNREDDLLLCPHCCATGRGGSMKRWHFDNCKHKPK